MKKQLRRNAEEVRWFVSCDKEAKWFLGGAPFTEEILRALKNHVMYSTHGLSNRRRVLLGTVEERLGMAVGYQETTILRNARMNRYDRKYLPLSGYLTYVQLKKIVVHRLFRGTGVSEALLRQSLGLARLHGLPWCADVKAENKGMCKFLEQRGATIIFLWTSPAGNPMIRFGIGWK